MFWLASKCSLADKGCKRHQIPAQRITKNVHGTTGKKAAFRQTKRHMTEEKLIQLVETIRTASGCMIDLDSLIGQFEKHVKNPSASELIFHSPSGRLLSAKEVVAKAMETNA
jgi:hypothetical protein